MLDLYILEGVTFPHSNAGVASPERLTNEL
jgi:hypothetical protein